MKSTGLREPGKFQKKAAMFELRRERHSYLDFRMTDRKEVEQLEMPVDADVLLRDDGLKIIRFGARRGISGLFFRYVKGDVTFDFYTDRTHWEGTATETCAVTIWLRRGQPLGHDIWPVERARFEPIAADIDAALRNWPAYPEDQGVPIETVIIHVTTSGGPEELAFEFRQTSTTPAAAPSPRWQRQFLTYGMDQTREREALVRDDGVTLICFPTLRGPANDGPDSYVYRDAEAISFEFTAERRLALALFTDTWEVDLTPMGSAGRTGFTPAQSARCGQAKVSEILQAIEEGLLAWPLLRPLADPPARRVVFVAKGIALPTRTPSRTDLPQG